MDRDGQLFKLFFPKKSGGALAAAAPFVNEVYADEYPNAPPASSVLSSSSGRSAPPPRSEKNGQLLHMAVHTIPRDEYRSWRVVLLAMFVLVWVVLYPPAVKVLTLVCALAYSFVEFTFTAVERRRPYTSLAQFGANLLYIPVLLHGYHAVFGGSALAFIALFPLNVWVLEVVEEWCIVRPVFGRNVAWCYLDYSDEFLHGCVRVGHGVAWWGMGAALWVLYPIVADLSETIVAAVATPGSASVGM